MNKKLLMPTVLLLFLATINFAIAESSQESQSKFNTITIKFVDALTLEPITNSKIEVSQSYEGLSRYSDDENYIYYNPNPNLFRGRSYSVEDVKSVEGTIKKEKLKPMFTDSNGEIKLNADAKSYSVRSDKGDNINYVKQGDSFGVGMLEEPIYTIYLNPIFDIEVQLKTDFNFLFSFFRMFRYGAYRPFSSSCVMTLSKGQTITQYSKTINLKAYFSRDLNSPTEEPYKCFIYAGEIIRKVAGIKQIDFTSMDRNQVNKFELPLDISYEDLMNDYPNAKLKTSKS